MKLQQETRKSNENNNSLSRGIGCIHESSNVATNHTRIKSNNLKSSVASSVSRYFRIISTNRHLISRSI